jgi:beta-1,4-mannosyl-glycoprotein beta-1,4-N-acetylglucosaminyltransferase
MIIDTFMFNQDFNALKIRLSELYDVVDLFIIAESTYTHSGKPKPLHLSDNIEKFSEYKDKIVIVTNKKRVKTWYAPIRELRQRQLISKHLKLFKLGKADLIIHSDCDEIPKKNVVLSLAKLNQDVNVLLELKAYSTRINLSDGIWLRGQVISGNLYSSIAKMRQDIFIFQNYDLRRHKLPFMRVPIHFTHRYFGLWFFPQVVINKPKLQIVSNAGWHFNNLFKLSQIAEKIVSSSHTELDTLEVHSKLSERYKLGKDPYTGKKLKIVDIDETYPVSIQNNLEIWSEYIIKTEKSK